MQKRLSMAIGLTVALLGTSGLVAAQTSSQAGGMSNADVIAAVEAAGYTNVREIEREGSHFDAEATKDNRTVHLHIDAKTGAVQQADNESEEGEEHEKDEKY